MSIVSVLTEKGVLSAEDAAAVSAAVAGGKSLDAALEEHGVSGDAVLKALSERFSIPVRALEETPVAQDALSYIPEESAQHYHFAPLGMKDGALEVGIVDPDDIEALDALQFISAKIGVPYKLFLISNADFQRVIDEYKNITGEVGAALTEFEGSDDIVASFDKDKKKDEEIEETTIKADAPVTKIVATILRYAVEGGASDIHIEPTAEKTRVRFRMDGDLHTSLELPVKVHQSVVARIKVLAQLRLDERRKPQDGRFSATVEKHRIDFRVSTFPTEYGEKVVMRILDRSKTAANMDAIGFSKDDLETVRALLKKPYGIILISGPTGSGKSTTLFSMLSELDRESANVVSVEDPVEYEIDGVAQSQVRPEIGYTFAAGLRSILRQDPDIIMVGEIRDKETAQLAIQAALTGHLVFSTIHTNTAAGVIPRLIDMGVDPYLIAPTLIAAIGQRLVRKLCDGGGQAVPMTPSIQQMLAAEFADLPAAYRKRIPEFTQFYQPSPTADCPNGTRGRMAVFEILKMNPEIEKIVLASSNEEKVYAAARAQGMLTMREDAIIKALDGKIPFQEVNTLGGAIFPDNDVENEQAAQPIPQSTPTPA